MPCFCIQTSDEPLVKHYFDTMHQRMNQDNLFKYPFSGGVRHLRHGIYAIEIEPRYPRVVLNGMAICLLAGAIMASILGAQTLALMMGATSAVALCVVNIFWSPSLYQLIMFVQVRRTLGRWTKVHRAEDKLIRMVLYGKD